MADKILRIVIPNLPPMLYIVTENNVTRVEGEESRQAEFVYRFFKGRVEFVPCGGVFFGQYLGPGTWSGAYGMVARGEADAMLGVHVPSLDVAPYFGFTSAVKSATYTILSGPPNAFSEKNDSLLSSVSQDIWIALGCTWIILSFLSYIFGKIEKNVLHYKDCREETLFGYVFAYYGLLFERGFDFLPNSTFQRLLLTGWLILCEVLMSDIGGTLASKLSVLNVPQRINSLKDLLDHPNICPYTPKGTSLDGMLQYTTFSALRYSNALVGIVNIMTVIFYFKKFSLDFNHQELWRRITACNGALPLPEFFKPEIMNEINDGSAVLVSNSDFAIPEVASQECRRHTRPLYLAQEPLFTTSYTFYYRKDLDLQRADSFRRSCVRYAECGFVLLASKTNYKYSLPCFAESTRPTFVSAVSVKDLAKIFQIWMIGMAVSIVSLFIERVWRYKETNQHL